MFAEDLVLQNATIHLKPNIQAAMIENGVPPELTSSDVITRVCLAVLFYIKKKDPTSDLVVDETLDENNPLRWKYQLKDGEISMNPYFKATLINGGVCNHLTTNKVLTSAFLSVMFHYLQNIDPDLYPVLGQEHPQGNQQTWAYTIANGEIHLNPDLRAAILESDVDPRVTSPEVLTKAFLATSFYHSRKGTLP